MITNLIGGLFEGGGGDAFKQGKSFENQALRRIQLDGAFLRNFAKWQKYSEKRFEICHQNAT